MLAAQFFTTINSKIFFDTLKFFSYKLPYIKYGQDVDRLMSNLKNYLNAEASRAYSFYNGRSALFWWLKFLPDNEKNEIIVSAYTCVSVVNAVKQAGYKAVYADIDDTLNTPLESIKSKVSDKTKAIIVQHTFWNPASVDEIINFAKSHNIFVIEDCAHALWSGIWDKKVWTFWDMSIFSFWRDKVISWVTGWVLLVNNEDIKPNPKLFMPSSRVIFQNLMYNIIAYLAWKTYDIKLWKVLMYVANKFKLIPPILTPNEKACNFDNFYFALPNSLAYLALQQLKILDKINTHRKQIAELYINNLSKKVKFPSVKPFYNNIYFWVPVFVPTEKIDEIIRLGKKNNIYFWIYWSGQNIVPKGSSLESCDYKLWSCPTAEKLSKQILILPNHYQVSLKNAKKVIDLLYKVL